MAFDGIGNRFTVKYRHRTWNHICWTYDGKTREVNFYFNERIHQKAIFPIKYQVNGNPEYKNQFLVFGQEPDSFKGGYDQYQLLQGKISRFNWWSSVLKKSYITDLSTCKKNGKGNIVNWTKSSFVSGTVDIIKEIDPRILCVSAKKLLFFPGRLRLNRALNLCAAHGGWIVVPDSPEENLRVLNMYKENSEGCKQDGMNVIGWLGVNYYEGKLLVPKSNRSLNFNNFRK